MNKTNFFIFMVLMIASFTRMIVNVEAQEKSESQTFDEKVRAFLEKYRSDWYDLNVPYRDGQFLYDLIVKNQYTRALEIGTSTGHSGIWLAWALSKTGGKLLTIEIDEERHAQALANFKEAGVADYIDARLADAHQLVKELDGPFDFVFSDADKDWYKQYFIDVAPKMTVGGCFTAHNITQHSWGGISEFVDYIRTRSDFTTTIENSISSGISVSYKTDDQKEK